jgi:hypothetical protein
MLIYFREFYGKLGWGFVENSNVSFGIKIDDYKIRL